MLQEVSQRAEISLEGRKVQVRAWKYEVKGLTGGMVPVLFLDTNLAENSEGDRTLTDTLYGGDAHYRICQEIVLGIGGVRLLRALGCQQIRRFHMNEGHPSLLTLELLDETLQKNGHTAPTAEDFEAVRSQCVFTTHTPVPAGHDRFPIDLASQVLGQPKVEQLREICCVDGMVNTTHLALGLSR